MPPTLADNLAPERKRELAAMADALAGALAGRVYSPRLKLLSIEQVCEATGLGKSTIYQMVEAGTFPKPQMNLGKNRWRESALIAWMDANDPNRGNS